MATKKKVASKNVVQKKDVKKNVLNVKKTDKLKPFPELKWNVTGGKSKTKNGASPQTAPASEGAPPLNKFGHIRVPVVKHKRQ